MDSQKRVLPSWMMKKVGSAEVRNDLTPEDRKPLLTFSGRIDYCSVMATCGEACGMILNNIGDAGLVLGFDMEWPVSYQSGSGRAALIQLCPGDDVCHLFHVSCMKNLPKAFVILLEHPLVTFVGANIKNDLWKLSRDFGVCVEPLLNKTVDLGEYANQVLNCRQTWSLDGLVLNLLKRTLLKSDRVRKSDWSAVTLSEAQKSYAATDAYASLLVYRKLKELARSSEDKPCS
ncbi:3'-5' exonuclease isoform X2 [Bacillus rossius redtenbacheri]|uniref:3'-5' exonuclease isoform X2 n=1 Tax=Bacillus rossius redtenbacheri TaxID=93214 RepID=UPI002FDD96EB